MLKALKNNIKIKDAFLFRARPLIFLLFLVNIVGFVLITESSSAQVNMISNEEMNIVKDSRVPTSSVAGGGRKDSQIIIKNLEARFRKLIENIETYSTIKGETNLETTEDGKKLLGLIMATNLSKFLEIDSDDYRIKEYFKARGQSKLASILRKWNLPELELESYLSMPFFIKTVKEGGEKKYKFITSSKLQNVNDSTFLFYMIFFKAYAALPEYFKDKPSAFAYGLCSLLAEDALYRSNMAVYPEMEIETATVALLIKKNVNLLWKAFPEEEDSTRFSSESYISMLKDAISKAGSSETSLALEEILKSPEEYAAVSQGVEKNGEGNKEKLTIVPPIEPAMRTLWSILPSTESELKSTVTWIEQNINNITLKLVLINACHDKLCAIFGSSKAGVLVNSTMLLRQIAEGYLDDQGLSSEKEEFIKMIDNQRGSLFEDFIQELDKRGQDEQKIYEIAFDPTALEWTFRYFYNYSLQIRKKVKELADSIKKEHSGYAGIQIDLEVRNRIKENKTILFEWWRTDNYLKKLFDKVGEPILDLKYSPVTRTGLELTCKWVLKRKGSSDSEVVIVRIIDPFSSGGGKPYPGVSSEAEVVVRKTLESDPEIVKLGTVEKGYYIQTASRIDSINVTNNGDEDMKEDWARILVVKQKPTRAPWSLDSGANNPLEIGRIQRIRTEKGNVNSDTWEWRLPIKSRKGKDRLLGIKPEGVVGNDNIAEFYPDTLIKSEGLDKELQLISLKLSHREVKDLKESGKKDWGYFANSCFVHAPVVPAPEGVDGNAHIQLPGDNKQLDELQAKSMEVNAFDFGNPGTFVDKLEGVKSKLTDYVITISYKLSNGNSNSIQVAEGQSLIVYTNKPRPRVKTQFAYQLKKNDKLVCAFNAGGLADTATITGLKSEEKDLGVYSLKLKELPLVRINDILIPVETEMVKIFPGVENTALIQMSPGLDAIRKSTSNLIDLVKAQVLIAYDVPMLKVRINDESNNQLQIENGSINQEKNKTQIKNSNQLLTYSINSQIGENAFWQTTVVDKKPYNSSRYIRIITTQTSLVCGNLQRIFVTSENSFNELTSKEARDIKNGEKVAFLDKDTGKLSLERIENIERMYQSKKSEDKVALLEFVVGESGLYRKSELLIPTMFANGILVEINVAQQGGASGPGWGGKGKLPGKVKTPQVRGPGKHVPDIDGVMRKVPPEKVKVTFDKEDLYQFNMNRKKLLTVFNRANYNLNKVREQVFTNFLNQFFAYSNTKNEIYTHIKDYFNSYLSARDFFIGTGNARVLPALVNEYVFLATLMYEVEAKNVGDVLTQDFLCIVMRTLKSGGKYFFQTSDTNIRNSLHIIRDLLLYVRDKSNKSGYKHVTDVTFDAESWVNVLTEYFVNQGCSKDIFNESNGKIVYANLQNLFIQLDNWVSGKLSFSETFVAPDFVPGVNGENIFNNNNLAKSLNINQRAIQ